MGTVTSREACSLCCAALVITEANRLTSFSRLGGRLLTGEETKIQRSEDNFSSPHSLAGREREIQTTWSPDYNSDVFVGLTNLCGGWNRGHSLSVTLWHCQ